VNVPPPSVDLDVVGGAARSMVTSGPCWRWCGDRFLAAHRQRR